MKILHTIAFLLLSGSMTAANIYTKTPKGVTVAVKKHYAGQTALVRLQVLGEKIIRVSATAENSFSDQKSLIIVPQNKHVNYSVSEKADTVIVETKALKAKVNGITGEVWFTDSKGNLLLQEKKGGGKIFKPYSVTQIHGQYSKSLNHQQMRPSTDLDSIRQTNGTTKEETRNSFNITQR